MIEIKETIRKVVPFFVMTLIPSFSLSIKLSIEVIKVIKKPRTQIKIIMASSIISGLP
jgi:hypothetical protein